MPVKISETRTGGVQERLDKFRKTIPDDEGYSMRELAERPEIGASAPHIFNVLSRRGWFIRRRISGVRARTINLLVNPKMLKKYANATE